MHSRSRQTLRSKLLRISVAVMLATNVVTLGTVAWLNFVTENHRLTSVENYIRASVSSKGATLAESHAIALKGMVTDNAFTEVRHLVAWAVEQDPDVVYGLFVSSDAKAWAYVSPTTRAGPTSPEAWEELGVNSETLRATQPSQRRVTLFGQEIQEFAAPVSSDNAERLGTVVYGLSNARLRQTMADAREQSRQALAKALAAVGGVGLFSFLLGLVLVTRAAAVMTAPVVALTAAANEIAKGVRGIRVTIKSGDEVELLAASFNHMLEANENAIRDLEVETRRALEAERLKSVFLANMSHEIRTPMNGVLGMITLIQTQPLEGKLRRYVDAIESSANALLTIINDVLDFSKLEAGKYSLQSVPFQPRLVVQEVAELLASRAHEKHLELVYRTEPSLPDFVIGDPDRLRQILNNLVGNAIKFTDRGEVFINATVASLEAKHIVLRVAVQDTGIGIDSTDIPKLYEAFSQVDGSTIRRFGGTGLGLAICKRLVTMMGGDIDVESRAGSGTTFTFTVRCGVDERDEQHSVRPDWLVGKRALVADPSARWREVLEECLHKWGLDLEVVPDARLAIDRLEEAAIASTPFDVAILGADASDLPVDDLTRAIRSRAPLRQLPIICLTTFQVGASVGELERELVLQLQKPIRFSELYNCLVGMFSGSTRQPSAKTRVESVRPPAAGTKRVLVVDDNDINRFVAVEELELRGYLTDVAANGLEALEKVKNGDFLAVLMDCQMPVMDGYTATREIRSWEGAKGKPRIPIIALTAHALVGERERVLQAGMDDYLSKPFRASVLERLLKRYITSDAVKGNDVVVAGPGGADLLRDVRRSKKLIELFLARVPEQLDCLAEAVSRRDVANIRAHAHKLKGSCLAVEAPRMAEAAESLQHKADGGDVGGAAEIVGTLRTRFACVEALLREELVSRS